MAKLTWLIREKSVDSFLIKWKPFMILQIIMNYFFVGLKIKNRLIETD